MVKSMVHDCCLSSCSSKKLNEPVHFNIYLEMFPGILKKYFMVEGEDFTLSLFLLLL